MTNVATKKLMWQHSGNQKTEVYHHIPYYVETLFQANGSRDLLQHFTAML